MWRTACGDRILKGAEARVFAEALLNLLDEITEFDFDDYKLGVECFDILTFGQKISVLSRIANGLFRKDVPPVELTAVLEGAIAAVFEHLTRKIIIEIDDFEPETYWRELVVAARKEMEAEDIPHPTCENIDIWYTEVEGLSAAILWDADYEDEDLYIDKPPEQAQALKDFMRIRDDYFLEVPEELKPKQIKAKLSELKKLCQSICEKTNGKQD